MYRKTEIYRILETLGKTLQILDLSVMYRESVSLLKSNIYRNPVSLRISGERGKIVDTTEFRRDLIGILREVKSRDLKDLKDIKILKDLKEKNIKISDFVDNLCITHVDNSMVAEYVSVMFRIAFPANRPKGFKL